MIHRIERWAARVKRNALHQGAQRHCSHDWREDWEDGRICARCGKQDGGVTETKCPPEVDYATMSLTALRQTVLLSVPDGTRTENYVGVFPKGMLFPTIAGRTVHDGVAYYEVLNSGGERYYVPEDPGMVACISKASILPVYKKRPPVPPPQPPAQVPTVREMERIRRMFRRW